MSAASPSVVDVTIKTFEEQILKAPPQVLVVVDFWAPWCAPCRQLAPILEKLAGEYGGRILLAKVNTEEEQQLAAAFGVQSIPLVVAFRGGQPIDQFNGLLPEAAIRQWIDRLLPSAAELLMAEAEALESTDRATSIAKYREVLELDGKFEFAKIGLARVLLADGRLDECRELLDELAERGYLEPEAERLQSELDVRTAAVESGGVEEARKAAESDPDNPQLTIQLADALAASSKHREALELLLGLVQANPSSDAGKQAKETMVKVFAMLGNGSELAGEFRRKLASAMY